MNPGLVQQLRSRGRDFGAELTRDIGACRRFTDHWAVVHWAHCASVGALFTELTAVISRTDYPISVLPSSGLLRLYANGACSFPLEELSDVELDLVAACLKQSSVENSLSSSFTREAYGAINLRNLVFAVLLSVEEMLACRGTELRDTTFAFESCSVISRYVATGCSSQVSLKRGILEAYSLLHAAILRTRGTIQMAVREVSENGARLARNRSGS